MKEHKKYIKCDSIKNANHLAIEVFYSKGGVNYLSGKIKPRGYYLNVRPVNLANGMISFELFSGHNKLVLETGRYSDKQFDKAIEMAGAFEAELIAVVIKKESIN